MEPWCDLWVVDEPLAYQPAHGQRISFKLYNTSGVINYLLNFPDSDPYYLMTYYQCLLGPNWYNSWFSCMIPDNADPSLLVHVTLIAPGGGVRIYTNFDGTMPEFSTNTRLLMETNATGDIIGFRLLYPSGAEDVYEASNQPSIIGVPSYFLSQQINAQGWATKFTYTNTSADGYTFQLFLQYVIDGDDKTNTINYTNVVNWDVFASQYYTNYIPLWTSNVISSITDPYGRTASFVYIYTSTNGVFGQAAVLTNEVDEGGISSYFVYSDQYNGYQNSIYDLAELITPYGTNSFYVAPNELAVVTEANGSHQMFCYAARSTTPPNPSLPAVYTDVSNVPTNRPVADTNMLDNPDWNNSSADDNMNTANSFYWGRQQFDNLSTNFLMSAPNWDPSKLTTNDLMIARLRHWNERPDEEQGNNLSMEREPSPDDAGTITGKMTWYGYAGKPDFYVQGFSDNPSEVIKVLPDGTEQYTIYQLDQWGNRTNAISTYSVNGTVYTRTNSYVYTTNGIDLLIAIGPDGVTNAAYGYNTNHQVLFMTNALGEVTSYTYNTNQQLTSITQPNGLLTTNFYGSDSYPTQQIVVGFSTNSYTYTNGLVYTHTDERGLTITNSWDALERLTNMAYPDGTSISYIYSNLDLVRVIDRMGHTTSYSYNSLRQKISETDALGRTTSYAYCDCGALYAITNALGKVTYFNHDNQGNLTKSIYPDGYTVNNTWNLVHQLVVRSDSSGLSISNYYNNQGLLITSSNNVARLRALAYDIDDRVTNSIDANNVSVGKTYDNLYRLLARSYPDGGVEKFGYTLSVPGPTSYTNQIGNVVLYGYDAMNRKTNEVYVGVTTNAFAYNGVGDLLALTDGNNHITTWGYDSFGRVTNKVDAAGITNFVYQYDADNRLTNRWSAARGSTTYKYDAVGNLTNVLYPISPAIALQYDAVNRLTNMVDAVGTTVYGYDAAGQLLSEDGPWPNDTVSYSYNNRLRTGLSLQAPDAEAWTQGYSYDSARRLTSVTSPIGAFDYTYDAVQLQRVDELTLPNGAYITNAYDSVARLLSTALESSSNSNLDSYAYGYNQANQRTNVTRTAGDFVKYTYDNMGELKMAVGKEAGGTTNRWQEQFGYAYDAAGNLNYRTNNTLLQAFNVNNLNELTTETNNGRLTVAGTTTSPATNVTVNTSNAFLYADVTFASTNQPWVNGNNTYTAVAHDVYNRWSTNSVTVNLPGTNNYSYDLNGNPLGDGTRNFSYDDEDELTNVWVTNAWQTIFVYDGKLRRRIERDYSWNGGAWVQTNEIHFIYDGNVVIQERDINNLPQVTYTRGNDLSGTLQGAGGIDGLLARTANSLMLQTTTQPQATSFYHADGNGNVTMLISSSQMIVAKYLYDPYGNTLAMSGSLASANRYRFSSKEWNDNAGLYYYLYRFYDPNLQRWPNRDPLGEDGFETLHRLRAKMARWWNGNANLYSFVGNNPNTSVDRLGLDTVIVPIPGPPGGLPIPVPVPCPSAPPSPPPPNPCTDLGRTPRFLRADEGWQEKCASCCFYLYGISDAAKDCLLFDCEHGRVPRARPGQPIGPVL